MFLSNPNGLADTRIPRVRVSANGERYEKRQMHGYEPEILLWTAVVELARLDATSQARTMREHRCKASGRSFLDTIGPGDVIYECALALA